MSPQGGQGTRVLCAHPPLSNLVRFWPQQHLRFSPPPRHSHVMLRTTGINPDTTANCVVDSGGVQPDGGENSLLKNEVSLRENLLIVNLPTIMVNQQIQRGVGGALPPPSFRVLLLVAAPYCMCKEHGVLGTRCVCVVCVWVSYRHPDAPVCPGHCVRGLPEHSTCRVPVQSGGCRCRCLFSPLASFPFLGGGWLIAHLLVLGCALPFVGQWLDYCAEKGYDNVPAEHGGPVKPSSGTSKVLLPPCRCECGLFFFSAGIAWLAGWLPGCLCTALRCCSNCCSCCPLLLLFAHISYARLLAPLLNPRVLWRPSSSWCWWSLAW